MFVFFWRLCSCRIDVATEAWLEWRRCWYARSSNRIEDAADSDEESSGSDADMERGVDKEAFNGLGPGRVQNSKLQIDRRVLPPITLGRGRFRS